MHQVDPLIKSVRVATLLVSAAFAGGMIGSEVKGQQTEYWIPARANCSWSSKAIMYTGGPSMAMSCLELAAIGVIFLAIGSTAGKTLFDVAIQLKTPFIGGPCGLTSAATGLVGPLGPVIFRQEPIGMVV